MANRTKHEFRVALQADPNVYRDIEITSTTSLYRFAAVIVSAFDFQFEHAFGFYPKLTGRDILGSEPRWELFRDIGESTEALSVEKTKIAEVFTAPGQKMLFLFDYGDDWRFVIELLGIEPVEKGVRYPWVVGRHGEAPEQYPDLDETIH